MKYPNIKRAKLSHAEISKAMGYKNVNSFRCSSAHKRIMQGVDCILEQTSSNHYGESHLKIAIETIGLIQKYENIKLKIK